MRALLDVNVLIALLDQDHSLHQRAREWFGDPGRGAWASCPLTQNGCVRIMSNPGYPRGIPVAAAIRLLREAIADSRHEFWPDDLSLLDERVADGTRIHGPRQLTDLYLLALAVRRGGKFITFDGSIAIHAIKGAETRHIVAL